MTKKGKLVAAAALVAVLICTYFGCYLGARVCVKNGYFVAADRLLFVSPLTKLHDSKLVTYANAGNSLQNRHYDEAKEGFASISGYLEADGYARMADYRHALQCADKNEFSKAFDLMSALAKQGYGDSKEKEKEIKYRWAWALAEEGKYLEAYDKMDSIRSYPGAKDALSLLSEPLYIEGQIAYSAGQYYAAKPYFSKIPDFEDAQVYLTLIKVHSSSSYFSTTEAKKIVDQLEDYFYFEDTAELLVSHHSLAKIFLLGTWKGDGYYFTMKDTGGTTYNLPWLSGADYYRIENGIYYVHSDSSPEKPQFRFTLLTPDSMNVYDYKNSKTYTLYRK